MKNTFLSIVTLAILLVSCNEKNKQAEVGIPTTTKTASELYACPMHPEVKGKKEAECSECGMELTEKVVSVSKIGNRDTFCDVRDPDPEAPVRHDRSPERRVVAGRAGLGQESSGALSCRRRRRSG